MLYLCYERVVHSFIVSCEESVMFFCEELHRNNEKPVLCCVELSSTIGLFIRYMLHRVIHLCPYKIGIISIYCKISFEESMNRQIHLHYKQIYSAKVQLLAKYVTL